MKVTKYDGEEERVVLGAMILSSPVLSKIAPQWESLSFTSQWANALGHLCVKYHREYGKAPLEDIFGMARAWCEGRSEEDVRLVDRLLSNLDLTSQENNSDFLIDLAHKHFNRVRIAKTIEKAQARLDEGRLNQAEEELLQFSRVEMGMGSYISLLTDEEAIRSTFQEEDDNDLISYPGDLGMFVKGLFRRSDFVAFTGADKSGKTFALIDAAWRAATTRKFTAFFEVGDMSEKQIKRRFLVRAARKPSFSPTKVWPCEIPWPISLEQPESYGKPAQVGFKQKSYSAPIKAKDALEACQRIIREKIKSKKEYLRIYTCPPDTISALGIKAILEDWHRQGWGPVDFVGIDYADLLAPPLGKHKDLRDQTNATWKHLRALSLGMHCLVVTATQSDADGYNKYLLDRRNFSEDKRKNAHVTGMVCLNVAGDEKDLGLCRWNITQAREMRFSSKQFVHVAGCLALGQPVVKTLLNTKS